MGCWHEHVKQPLVHSYVCEASLLGTCGGLRQELIFFARMLGLIPCTLTDRAALKPYQLRTSQLTLNQFKNDNAQDTAGIVYRSAASGHFRNIRNIAEG